MRGSWMRRMAHVLVGLACVGALLGCELFAKTFTVAYDGNGSTSGSAPMDGTTYQEGKAVIVLGNNGDLAKTDHVFAGWNTAADGSGTGYAAGATFTMGAGDVTLYAVWTQDATYSVTYVGNGNTGGSVPTDGNHYLPGATVTVADNSGSLVSTGSTFAGWNTKADGSGAQYTAGATFSMGTVDVTLYAMWNSQTASLSAMVLADSYGGTYDLSFSPTTYSYDVWISWNDGWLSGDPTFTLTLTPASSKAKVASVSEWNTSGEAYADTNTGSAYALTLTSYTNYVTVVVMAQDGTIAHYWMRVGLSWYG